MPMVALGAPAAKTNRAMVRMATSRLILEVSFFMIFLLNIFVFKVT